MCRKNFMENELQDLCGSTNNVNTCPLSTDAPATYAADSLIGVAQTAVSTAQTDLAAALNAQAGAKSDAADYQAFMEAEIKQATQNEEQANKRLNELMEKLADLQILAKALNRAIMTLASHETGGVDSVPQRLTPGMTVSFVQLQEEVAKEKQANNTYAEKLEKQLLAFEVAAGVSTGNSAAPKEEQKKEALVQESNPARLYLMNDRADMLIAYLRSLYKEVKQDIATLQAGLKDWQDAPSPNSIRDNANAAVLARMTLTSTTDTTNSMTTYRAEEIYRANQAAELRRDLQSKQAQLDMMRTYMRETQMNQVIESEACSARAAERTAEKKAIDDAIAL